MGRPRKNRIGEYASLLGEELSIQLSQELEKSFADAQRAYQEEIAELRAEIRRLSKAVDGLARRAQRSGKPKLGRWVPGGPGRPPKDAAERIAAFEARHTADEEE